MRIFVRETTGYSAHSAHVLFLSGTSYTRTSVLHSIALILRRPYNALTKFWTSAYMLIQQHRETRYFILKQHLTKRRRDSALLCRAGTLNVFGYYNHSQG